MRRSPATCLLPLLLALPAAAQERPKLDLAGVVRDLESTDARTRERAVAELNGVVLGMYFEAAAGGGHGRRDPDAPEPAVIGALRAVAPGLARAAVRSGDAEVRRAAGQLVPLVGEQAAPALAEAMKEPAPAVRLAAAKLLAELPGHLAAPPLLAAKADADAGVRAAVLGALGRTLDRPGGRRQPKPAAAPPVNEVVAALVAGLADADPTARRAAARVLGRLRRLQPRPALPAGGGEKVVAALGDADAEVRRAALGAAALWPETLATPAGAAALEVALASPSTMERHEAVEVAAALPAERAVPLLARLANDPYDPTREAAVRALATHGAAVWPALRPVLTAAEPARRAGALAAVAALARSGWTRPPADELAGAVAPLLRDPEAPVRAAAGLALQEAWTPAALPALAAAAADPADAVRLEAVRALARAATASSPLADPAPAAQALLRAAKDGCAAVRAAAVEGLAGLTRGATKPAAVEALSARLADADRATREAARRGLEGAGPEGRAALQARAEAARSDAAEEARALVARLGGPDGAAAAEALVRRSSVPDVVAALAEGLQQVDATRHAAVRAVAAKLEADAAVAELLARGLADLRRDVRWGSARGVCALGAGGAGAAPALAGAVADRDDQVREEVVLALAALGPAARVALPALLERCRTADGEDAARAAAAAGRVGQSTPEDLERLLAALRDPALPRDVRGGLVAGCLPPAPAAAAKLVPAVIEADGAPEDLRALGALEPAHAALALPPLQAALVAGEPERAARAAVGLGALGPLARAAAPALARAAGSPDQPLARAAISALGDLGPYAVPHVAAVAAGLKAPTSEARVEAAMTLAELGLISAEARRALVAHGDERPEARMVLMIHLEPLGARAKDCIPAIERWVKAGDGDGDVAVAAEDVLPALRGERPPSGLGEPSPERAAEAKAALARARAAATAGPPEAAVRAFWTLARLHEGTPEAAEALAWLDAHPPR